MGKLIHLNEQIKVELKSYIHTKKFRWIKTLDVKNKIGKVLRQ